MYILEGKLVPKKIRIGIVASRFNEFITSKLLSGALDCLRRHEVPEDAVTVAGFRAPLRFRSSPPVWLPADAMTPSYAWAP